MNVGFESGWNSEDPLKEVFKNIKFPLSVADSRFLLGWHLRRYLEAKGMI